MKGFVIAAAMGLFADAPRALGAAGGARVRVLNNGKDVRVPAETLLMFTLDTPASLQAER